MNCLSYGGHWYYWHCCMSWIFNGVDVLTVEILLINQTLILCIQLVVRTIQVFLETWDDLHIHLKMSNCHWCVFTPCTSSCSCHCRCAGTVLPSSHRDREFILGKSFRMIKSSHEPSTTTLVTIKPYPGAKSMFFCIFPGMVTPPVPREVNERIWGRQKGSQSLGMQSQEIPWQRWWNILLSLSSCTEPLSGEQERQHLLVFAAMLYWELVLHFSTAEKKKKKQKKPKNPNMKKSNKTKFALLCIYKKKKIFLLFHMKHVSTFYANPNGCFIWSVPCVINNFCASVLLSLVMVLR